MLGSSKNKGLEKINFILWVHFYFPMFPLLLITTKIIKSYEVKNRNQSYFFLYESKKKCSDVISTPTQKNGIIKAHY